MEWGFLKAIGWVLLALIAMWVRLGRPIRNVKSFVDLWLGK
jgi:hypothetical protein